ncbi:hypothetical protein MTP04_24500 [Lysinibacillus sp. PLM2]|nr:hypothetical protein MTP04_24500 [Lysinibacillus sp. PLM2]
MDKQCTNLSNEQIEMIRTFINNYDKHNISICSCDITRVLDIDDDLPTRLEGSE